MKDSVLKEVIYTTQKKTHFDSPKDIISVIKAKMFKFDQCGKHLKKIYIYIED